MANHKSAEKRARQSARRRLFNRYYAKSMRNALRSLREQKSGGEAKKALATVLSSIDKLAKRGYIHANKAGNLKSGLMKKIAKLK